MDGELLTVGETLRWLLPQGSTQAPSSKSRKKCPIWAPDVFAVAATLIHLSGCYTEYGIAFSRTAVERKAKKQRADHAKIVGEQWASGFGTPKEVQELWDILLNNSKQLVCCGPGYGRNWKAAAFALLAIADEACAGIGYPPVEDDGLANYAWGQFLRHTSSRDAALQFPNSFCHMVPRDVACVMPKAMTPEVGCTLRSLSHHVSLLPSHGIVQAEWAVTVKSTESGERTKPLNLLLIPFPYVVYAEDFREARSPEETVDGYFELRQDWLNARGRKLSTSRLTAFVSDLVRQAEREVGEVHAVVFPEASLDQERAVGLARRLAKLFPSLELVVCGTLRSEHGITRNEAALIRLDEGRIADSFVQSKHHRWKLNGAQIRRYNLGSALDPASGWWENIAVDNRRIQFGVNRDGAVIAALVCEDLARYDPVLPVIASVGPTLVFALLMDGPQLESRWCGRYATALAEDPGSSVLTLTCLGMINRSNGGDNIARRIVGLWKDREGPAREIVLPEGRHGIVLSLTSVSCEQVTLDQRRDGGAVVEYRLGGINSVKLTSVPDWLER